METTVLYLARDPVFEKERAFDTDYLAEDVGDIRKTNHVFDRQPVVVHNIEDPTHWDIDTHGFCLLKATTRLDPDAAFNNKEEVQKSYWYDLEALLHERFPEYTRIESFDCTIRQRDPSFPKSTTMYVNYEQPATIPHCDYSQQGCYDAIETAFPGQDAFWRDKEFDVINVWRPLRGPNDDWPLIMCDWTSVDSENDILLNDGLRRSGVVTNSLLHMNSAHRWYFMKSQGIDDLVVFRNADTTGKRARCFHCSAFNPDATTLPRQSVEVRLVAFR
ncbi:uncharacterized protein MYCFIDRAFT_135396 [Pseudocercospora fijiensis CIRAD86]|uniref:CmcJ-like methyltransferase n=1 Tax=Pseudocercospora fijiensis (strain CIRAD86) TaxID=383855 RepID=M3B6V1_PSEFD|nr:uncharacterized protein MYCFIDRAFT_135396 [Pseudocercospora fijiensis CIRAD86]EME85067.1 hypothetical protein MYCFIDRAFT_135396 [Pseudocercospora fijiensis CIRAD86]